MLVRPCHPWFRAWTLWTAACAASLSGCQRTDALAPAAGPTAVAPATEAPEREIWEALFLEKAKIGYIHTTIRGVERNGRKLVEILSHNHLNLTRFGQSTVQDFKMSTLETPEGRVIAFTTEATLGTEPLKIAGHVDGDEMVIETAGTDVPTRIPWSREFRGFRGLEQSLEDRPMTAGEARSLRVLAPLLNVVAHVDLKAADYEMTSVWGKPADLLRIESVTRLADGNVIEETLWVDSDGQTIKRRIAGMRQESCRTTREQALAESPTAGAFDLGTDTIVKLERPLPEAHRTKMARYRVELAGGDPSKVFATGATQSLRSVGPRVAELTVRALAAGEPSLHDAHGGVSPEYTAANSILQIGDPTIRAMAAEARRGASKPRDVALALEHYVHRVVITKDFSQTFATAAEVAQSRQGDCTEHAVLLAALARACDIPARVAIGLVYVPRSQGFGYHMWTEVHVDGQWLPLDATLGQGGIGAAHIKLTDSSLDGGGAFSTFLPVAQVVGQLKINLLEAQ